MDQDIGYHLPTVINQVSIQVGGGGYCAGGCGDPSRLLALYYQPLSVGGISGGGCGDPVGYLAMGHQPPVGGGHVDG